METGITSRDDCRFAADVMRKVSLNECLPLELDFVILLRLLEGVITVAEFHCRVSGATLGDDWKELREVTDDIRVRYSIEPG